MLMKLDAEKAFDKLMEYPAYGEVAESKLFNQAE